MFHKGKIFLFGHALETAFEELFLQLGVLRYVAYAGDDAEIDGSYGEIERGAVGGECVLECACGGVGALRRVGRDAC